MTYCTVVECRTTWTGCLATSNTFLVVSFEDTSLMYNNNVSLMAVGSKGTSLRSSRSHSLHDHSTCMHAVSHVTIVTIYYTI